MPYKESLMEDPQKWRTFVDERPCVIPSIVNYHQRQTKATTTNYYNLTNSSEPIRMLDYFSRPISESHRNAIHNPNSIFTAYNLHSVAQVVTEPDHSSALTSNHYPLKNRQSPSVTSSLAAGNLTNTIERETLPSVSNLTNWTAHEVPASTSRQTSFVLYEQPGSVSCRNKGNDGSVDLTRESEINKNQLSTSGLTNSVTNEIPKSASSLNKENSDPVDLTSELEINRQYYRHFKKKRAKLEENMKESVKRMDGSQKVSKDDGADLTKYFKHKKLNRMVKYSTSVTEISALAWQDEKARRMPFKEYFSNIN